MERRERKPSVDKPKVDKLPEEVKVEPQQAPPPVPDPDAKIWWKKVGKGSLRFNHKIIKPGEKFRAKPSDIPKQFRDLVIPLEELTTEDTVAPMIAAVKTEYVIRPRGKSKTLFDVSYQVGEDEDGEPIWKTINDKPLPKNIAESMLAALSK